MIDTIVSTIILNCILFGLVFADVIIIHELIHYYVAKKLGYNGKIILRSKINPGLHLAINLGNKQGASDFVKISLAPFPATFLTWMIIPVTINIEMWWVVLIITLMECSNDLITSFLVWITWFSNYKRPVNFMKYLLEEIVSTPQHEC